MNYSRFLTQLSQNRQPSVIREMTNLLTQASPDLVFMAGGLPNAKLFPFQAASITLKDGHALTIHPKLMTDCLQYGPTPGYPPLVKQLKSLTERLHSPPCWADSDLIVTAGSQDGLCKALEMMVSPGDYVVTQEPCYTGTLSILNPYKPKYVPVAGDQEGMIPEALKTALSQWEAGKVREAEEDVPKVLYVNPNACNPSGVSLPEARRREIYKIASDYNLIILEDDPYYFVQFGDMKDFPPSFLSMDVDGRVLRFDSFSKVLSSGLRVGYVTGPKALVQRIVLHAQVSILHAPAMSQVLISELLELWGEEGFFKHTKAVQDFYFQQRNAMVAAAEKHLSDLCEWAVPTGGMFLWLKVPKVLDTLDMIMKRALAKNVIVVPGNAFMCDNAKPCQYMRAAFSLVTPEKMDKGLENLAELIREEIAQQESISSS
ncbi:kynurenine/alpha-aminoadipate aminotransferase, mitochondrial-like [Eriocheir sinensis]|uniref:kynurenine/alpha-aminoadipate aminotransferase, mitochondrial-like n=1 Tax=Eriocheir sinensis TaxID=95602 RepID=UPI0021C789E6|nr:kynurenine/alpha-aminoadipate aminotransferase, mitochondrial-like [Eriocheir sinensis]XP_050733947.1 kynurenine/alpha-aminoadipate aminotransferase, mitochondrial-like [Eriocheir sinensis]XP_050733948.1 kynurenine/alpha-aminoadipate aminotransferase, mitochondrial-like [Eriocheir sinensis]